MNAHTPISEYFYETARFVNLDRRLLTQHPFKLRRQANITYPRHCQTIECTVIL